MPINSDAQSLVDSFYHYLIAQKQRSLHTAINYRRDITQFLTATPISISAIGVEHVKQYNTQLHSRQLSHQTIHRQISSLHQFWEFLVQHDYAHHNPWQLIKRPRIKQTIPSYIPTETVIELLNNYPTTTNEAIRNKCILELLFVTGIRVSECCSLNIDDIHLTDLHCRVLGKGNKQRMVLFGQRCRDWLIQYATTIRHQWAAPTEPAFFLSKRGSRITQRTIQRILNDANQYHSSPIRITPHTCRHSCASMLLSNGAGIRDVQELLGHSSINTTQRYAHIPSKKLTQRFLNVMDDDTT